MKGYGNFCIQKSQMLAYSYNKGGDFLRAPNNSVRSILAILQLLILDECVSVLIYRTPALSNGLCIPLSS
jgi:hypothetical protein